MWRIHKSIKDDIIRIDIKFDNAGEAENYYTNMFDMMDVVNLGALLHKRGLRDIEV